MRASSSGTPSASGCWRCTASSPASIAASGAASASRDATQAPPSDDRPFALERGERGPQPRGGQPQPLPQAIDGCAGNAGIGDQLPQCRAHVAVGSLVPP